jgi:putative ABC transport system permease protein
MSGIWRDIHYALRVLRKNPGFAAIVALSLGLGIGLNTAVFSFVDAVLLHPFPYSQPERLVFIWGTKNFDVRRGMSGSALERWQVQSRTFEKIALFQVTPSRFNLANDESDSVQATYTGTDLFAVLGSKPLVGRLFTSSDDTPGAAKAIILSCGLWKSRFGGNPGIAGKTVRMDGALYTIVGVMPEDFFFPDRDTQLWVALTRDSGPYESAHGVGRLREGVSLAQAQAELDTFVQPDASPATPVTMTVHPAAFPFYKVIVGRYETALWMLWTAVLLLVLLGCTNIANLLLAHGVSREKELAVRSAMGAGRGDLFRQLLSESLVLCFVAGALGVLLGILGVRVLHGLHLVDLPGVDHAGLNGRVVMVGLGLSVLAGVLSGVLPAWKASRRNMHIALQEGGGGTQSRGHTRMRNLLVSLEAAIALVLLVSAGLVIRSFVSLTHSDWGITPENLLVAHVVLPKITNWNPKLSEAESMALNRREIARQIEFGDAALRKIREIPGIESATFAKDVPLDRIGWFYRPFSADGRFHPETCLLDLVGPDYFHTLGVRMYSGRDFTPQDSQSSDNVVVINHALAEILWPGQIAAGKRITFWELDSYRQDVMTRIERNDTSLDGDVSAYRPMGADSWDVIGVVGDIRMMGVSTTGDQVKLFDAQPAAYIPLAQSEFALRRDLVFAVRSRKPGANTGAAVRDALRSTNADIMIQRIAYMEQLISASIGGRGSNRLLVLVSILFGTLALVLSLTGVYAVVSHAAAQRTRELGIRMALGAEPSDILRLVATQGFRPIIWGVALGVASSWAVTRSFKSLMFGVSVTDPWMFVAMTGALLFVAAAACLLPSIRAMRTNPVEALRHE